MRGMAEDPLSPGSISSIRAWLSSCDHQTNSTHKACSITEAPYVPCRLISLDPQESSMRLRLIHGIDVHTHDPVRYAALSYCWGGPQKKQLTRANRVLYEDDISWHTLPKTLRDAVTTTHRLGLRYLWIDSLCIIQDDDDDKSTSISQMTKVYTHATVTIMDKRGSKAADGFLHPRSALPGSTYVKYEKDCGIFGWATLSFDKAVLVEDSGQLDTRGWTLQEQILSRRQLVFGPRFTEWSCRADRARNRDGWRCPPTTVSELGPGNLLLPAEVQDKFGGINAESLTDAVVFHSLNLDTQAKRLSTPEICSEWRKLINAYSMRSLTVSKDRVFAIAGLAESFAQCMVDSQRYITGIWECDMPLALLWHVPSRVVARSNRPVGYQGPSWSWVSIIDEVDHPGSSKQSAICILTALSVTYELENDKSLFGAVSNATLHITGPAISLEWRYNRDQSAAADLDISELRWRSPDLQNESFHAIEHHYYLDAREYSTDWTEVTFLGLIGMSRMHFIYSRLGSNSLSRRCIWGAWWRRNISSIGIFQCAS
jgi:hypothetical protein